MCGIFGITNETGFVSIRLLRKIAKMSERRGSDASGLLVLSEAGGFLGFKRNTGISTLIRETKFKGLKFAAGHTRLITDGLEDNQPVQFGNCHIIHNGIVINHLELWQQINQQRKLKIDTEVLVAISDQILSSGGTFVDVGCFFDEKIRGTVSCALFSNNSAEILLYSNNGSLFLGYTNGDTVFASEKHILTVLGCHSIEQVVGSKILRLPQPFSVPVYNEMDIAGKVKLANLGTLASEEKKLKYTRHTLRRCQKCILPETMPFIKFSNAGICNYCENYKPKIQKVKQDNLLNRISKFKFSGEVKCLVPFSGGRDSSYALHVLTKELGLNPITMTYDWGMVTDLARRNISRMCGELNVENILVADDLVKKRNYIKLNLSAWLKKPNLGMLNLLMAGDKHFFRHIKSIQKETKIDLNIWGMNHLEVTHFKAGFLGVPPDFYQDQVFSTGLSKQLKYQSMRFGQMLRNPKYFNRSVFDTLQGEYYRSVASKAGFVNIFDHWNWDEAEVNKTLALYDWETSPDSSSTWRIGDGTAAFYNYVYYKVAGFSEYDTFRSNQIREGQMTRSDALELVEEENTPRYPNIKWYLESIDMDFDEVIGVINSMPTLY